MEFDDGQLVNPGAVARLEGPQDAQVVGLLSADAAERIALPAECRLVRIHGAVLAHIRERRTLRDAAFVLEHLASAVERPKMIGRELRDYRRIRVVHVPDAETRWLHLCLKFVPAETAKSLQDELWVSTGHPVPAAIAQLRNKGTAWHILG